MKLGSICETCPYRDAKGPVLSDGDPATALVAIVGEAPGIDEVEVGKGFVGAAGWELWQLASIAGVAREDCVVANVVKCLPPGAEHGDYRVDPRAVAACSQHLDEEKRRWNPKMVVVAMGKTALEWATGETNVGRWRGARLEVPR